MVCVKQVPDTQEMRIDEESKTVVRDGVATIVNPFDEYAVEEGIRLKENNDGRLTALSMGPEQAADTLKESIARGADQGVLLSDPSFAGSDLIGTAQVLAAGLRQIDDADLVILGKQSSDGGMGLLGPALAEFLGWPHISLVRKIRHIGDGRIEVERLLPDGYEVIKSELPCLISVVKEINEPRLPSLKGVMRAKRAEVKVWSAADLGAEDLDNAGLTGAAARVQRAWIPERDPDTEMLGGDVEAQADALVQRLKSLKLL
ncbi:MAG: electron transfer flavoprotein subunit beta/FixA family protein [Thermaerobacterales bacterium]